MSELLGTDETLFSLWPEHFLTKPTVPGLDWTSKDQQLPVVNIPIVLLDDGRVAFQNEEGKMCLIEGVGSGVTEETLLPLSSVDVPTPELPNLSDAVVKSMLIPNDLDPDPDPQLPPCLEDKDDSEMLVDDDLRSLVSFRCQYCSYSSTDVPSLVNHSKTEHAQIHRQALDEQSCDSEEEINGDQTPSGREAEAELMFVEELEDRQTESTEERVVEQFVYLCSECSEGFVTVEECRDHMIHDHNMVFNDMESVVEAEPPAAPAKSNVEKEVQTVEVTPPPPASPPSPVATPPPPLIIKLPTKAAAKHKEYDPEFEAKPHKCPEGFCPHRFRSLTSLQKHVSCHTQMSDETKRFQCPECSVVFLKWSQCSMHLWKEHKLDVDLYLCNICKEFRTTTRWKLDCHAKIHSEDRPYKCSTCGKGFKQRTQLVNHAAYHNKDKSNAPKWYMQQKCEICLKMYSDSKSLKKHMQAVHSKLKPYKCNICGHMSARKAMLQTHIRQHTGEKPFTCDLCYFRTGDHNSLRRHIMRHTGKRPYKCPHCPYEAIQSSSYKSHLQNRHPGLSGGVFTCTQCVFVTVSEASYQKHLSDHKLNLIPPEDVEVFPENVAAAHLVYRSFGASPASLRCDVTASSTSRDGMKQTITISIPPANDGNITDEEDAHSFLPGDEIDTGGITIPAEPDSEPPPLICFD